MGKYGYSIWMGGLPERIRSRDIEDFFKGYGKILDVSMKTKYAFIEFEDKRDADDAARDLDDKKLNGVRVKLEMSKGCKDKYRDFQRTGHVRYRSFSREVSPGRRRYRSRSKGKGEKGGRSRSRSRSPPRGGGGGGGGEGGRGGGGGRGDSGGGGGGGRRETFYNKPAYRKYGAPEKTKWTVEVDNLSSRCSWQDLKDFMRKAGEVTYGAAHGEIGKNRGVVCYEREEEMQRALEELDGRDINGRPVKLIEKIREDWDSGSKRSRSRSRSGGRSRSPPPRRSRSGSPRRSRSRSRSGARSAARSASRGRSGDRARGGRTERDRSPSKKSEASGGNDRRSRSGSRGRKMSRSRSRSR